MGLTRWFGVEATRGKRFQFCLIELFPVANVPGAGEYGRNPVIAMGVRRNLCVRGHAQHDRVDARFSSRALEAVSGLVVAATCGGSRKLRISVTVYKGRSSISQCPEPGTTNSRTFIAHVAHDHHA